MKVEIRCKRGKALESNKLIEEIIVWSGELDIIPRTGESIQVFDGWCDEEVLEVWHKIEKKEIVIIIRPDYSGEYEEELLLRKAKKRYKTKE